MAKAAAASADPGEQPIAPTVETLQDNGETEKSRTGSSGISSGIRLESVSCVQ